MALPMALGVLLALTTSVTTVIQYASAGLRNASLSLNDGAPSNGVPTLTLKQGTWRG